MSKIKTFGSMDTGPMKKALKKMGKAASAPVLLGAVTDGAYIVQRRAVAIIREKNIIDMGELLGSVEDAAQAIDPDKIGDKLVIVNIGTNVEHGLYNELGTIYMAARPWLRPAFDESQEKAKRAMLLYLRRTLQDVL